MNETINYYINNFGNSFRSHLLNWGEIESLTESDLIEALVLWQWDIKSDVNILNCKEIISACVNNVEFNWNVDSLSFDDKVYILKQLTTQGFNVLYANINPYPATTSEFARILVNTYIVNDMATPSLYTKCKIEFYRYSVTIWRFLIFITLVAGLYCFDHTLLIASLLFSYVIWLLTFLHDHDHLTHRYITPKNKFIDIMLRLCCHIWGSYGPGATSITVFRASAYNPSHLVHHQFWKDPINDPYQHSVNSGFFKYIFAIPSRDSDVNTEKITTKIISFFMKNYILLLVSVVLLALGGLKIFFYFYIIPNIIVYMFPEIMHVIQHKFTKSAENEIDFIPVIPVFGIMGNHITHHINTTRQGTYGTKKYPWLKWVNIHYYVVKLLYNENKTI